MPAVPVAKEVGVIEQKELRQEEIAHRAYQLYQQRGCEPGKDVEDWARAEKELTSEIRVESVEATAARGGRK